MMAVAAPSVCSPTCGAMPEFTRKLMLEQTVKALAKTANSPHSILTKTPQRHHLLYLDLQKATPGSHTLLTNITPPCKPTKIMASHIHINTSYIHLHLHSFTSLTGFNYSFTSHSTSQVSLYFYLGFWVGHSSSSYLLSVAISLFIRRLGFSRYPIYFGTLDLFIYSAIVFRRCPFSVLYLSSVSENSPVIVKF